MFLTFVAFLFLSYFYLFLFFPGAENTDFCLAHYGFCNWDDVVFGHVSAASALVLYPRLHSGTAWYLLRIFLPACKNNHIMHVNQSITVCVSCVRFLARRDYDCDCDALILRLHVCVRARARVCVCVFCCGGYATHVGWHVPIVCGADTGDILKTTHGPQSCALSSWACSSVPLRGTPSPTSPMQGTRHYYGIRLFAHYVQTRHLIMIGTHHLSTMALARQLRGAATRARVTKRHGNQGYGN